MNRSQYSPADHGRREISAGALLEPDDPRYSIPTPDDIREALRRGILTGATAGELLGVTGRTIRKWTGGDQRIPYSAWRLILIYIGAVEAPRLDATIGARIVELLERRPGLTEAEIAEELFGPEGYQQRVNGDCRLLTSLGVLRRMGGGGSADPFRYEIDGLPVEWECKECAYAVRRVYNARATDKDPTLEPRGEITLRIDVDTCPKCGAETLPSMG